jgi:hypothetical protein
VGSLGFKNDYELSTTPGLRRLFSRLVDSNGFCKSDFSDIESNLPRSITENSNLIHLKNTIKKYSKVLPVCQTLIAPNSEESKKKISAFLAAYAKMRGWPSNGSQRAAISSALNESLPKTNIDKTTEILHLLAQRKYVVLQGAPGTGKTRATTLIANKLKAKIFFTQFHAETSYSDFIYGLRPNISNSTLTYTENIGVFTKALKYAQDNPGNTLLVIDEINRANLANVLGPIFYLFEYQQDQTNIEIEIYPGFSINKLPDNLYVLATMNTADRSLAVVDFALRRRFAWFTLKPEAISQKNFFLTDFMQFDEIFQWYASSNELNLQPGQGYFIANSDEEMINRIRYELLPLMKEYLQEGQISAAKEELNNYFRTRIGESLFE